MRGRPRGLARLLFAEFWERFSYFAVLSVFALYVNEHLHIPEGRAVALAGTLAALTYLTPLLGGWLADRVLGSWRTLLLGSVVLTAGYATLISPSVVAFYAAVGLLTFGSGLFKPNITACIGSLFTRLDDPCRSAAFRAFYVCVNLAAGIAPLTIGAIRSRADWPVVFGACALSALLCLFTLARTRETSAQRVPSSGLSMGPGSRSAGGGALAVLCVPAIAFSAIYAQSLGTLIFWSRDRVDLTLGGWLGTPINPAATCSMIPALAIMLSPTLEPLRRFLGHLGVMRSAASELRLSLLLAAFSIGILAIPEWAAPAHSRISATWLLASYVLATLSELIIVPLSLSLIEEIAPPGRVVTYTGVWYLSAAVGSQLAGEAGRLWGTMPAASYFLVVTLIPLAAYALLWPLGSRIARR